MKRDRVRGGGGNKQAQVKQEHTNTTQTKSHHHEQSSTSRPDRVLRPKSSVPSNKERRWKLTRAEPATANWLHCEATPTSPKTTANSHLAITQLIIFSKSGEAGFYAVSRGFVSVLRPTDVDVLTAVTRSDRRQQRVQRMEIRWPRINCAS